MPHSQPVTTATRVSLLFPNSSQPGAHRHGAPDEHDLALGPIIAALDPSNTHRRFIAGVLTTLETNISIIQYRQDIFADLLDNPSLRDRLTSLLPALRTMAEAGPTSRWRDNTPLLQVGMRLADLSNYVLSVEELWSCLSGTEEQLHAQGWLDLRSMLVAVREESIYQQLRAELPELRAQIERAGSVTIGINLDSQLQPESATVLGIHQGRFTGRSGVIERLIGKHAGDDTLRGITTLYKASENPGRNTEHELFRDMSRLLERVAAPVSSALERYTRLHAAQLIHLEAELHLYLGAARVADELRGQGLPICRPQFVATHERTTTIRDSYSLDLALRQNKANQRNGSAIVRNDVDLNKQQFIALLTGLNSGGKTTFTRAIGQAHVLGQAGLFVPGSAALLSPIDGIYSHFATAERLDREGGRLSEELERLAGLFAHATDQSLLLLNEPFTSTDHRSARELARNIFVGLRELRARSVFVTHIQELVDDLVPGAAVAGDGVVSLIAGATADGTDDRERPTYHIAQGRPRASSYAAELAQRFKLDAAQLQQQLRQRRPHTAEID